MISIVVVYNYLRKQSLRIFMEPGVVIREINKTDREAIINLSFQLGYPATPEEMEKRITAIMEQQDHCAYVAEYNQKVIGWIHAFYTVRIESEAFVEIAGLVVDQDFRKMQAGKRLVTRVNSWSLLKGVKSLRVRSNTIRTGAHKFYNRLGFKKVKEQAVFSIELSGVISGL
jgi:predicted N-acetyltransferase YhbS